MRTRNLGDVGAHVGLVLWILTCIMLFILYPGSRSVIHGTVIGNWSGLVMKLGRISPFAYLGTLVGSLVGLAVFGLAFVGVGVTALSALPGKSKQAEAGWLPWLAYLMSAFLVGTSILSVAFLALAGTGLLNAANVLLLLSPGLAVAGWQVWRWFQQPRRPEAVRAAKAILAAAGPLGMLAALVVILSLGYTASRISFDSTAIYFSDAKITALTHSVRYFVEDPFLASVFQPGATYAALIVVFGDLAARMFSWANGLAIIVLCLALAARLGLSRRAQLVLLVMVVTTTALLDLMGDGKIDLAASAPALAAIYWMVASPRRSRMHDALVGFLAGIAMAARPFNMLLMPLIIVLFLSYGAVVLPSARSPNRYRELLVSLGWTAIGTLPWILYILAANWLLAGDPIAFIRSYAALRAGAWDLSFPSDHIWSYRLLYPFSVTFINHGQSLGNITPLFISFLPLGLYKEYRSRIPISPPGLQLVLTAAGALVLWLCVTSMVFEIRYVLAFWVVLYVPVAMWVDAALTTGAPIVARASRLALIIILLFMLARTLYVILDTYSPVDSQGSAHCYDIVRCAPLDPVNHMGAPGDRVLMLSAFRYYLRADLFACSTNAREYQLLQQLSRTDPAAFWAEAYREGNRFVVIQGDYVGGHLYMGITPSPANAPPWLTLTPLFGAADDNEVSYRLVATNPPVAVEEQCVKRGGVWQVESLARAAKTRRWVASVR